MDGRDKPLVWLHGLVKTPPFTEKGRIEAGFLLRSLQQGENLGMPHSRPMPSIGKRCHELRVGDASGNWRIIYRVDDDAVVILEVFKKKTPRTPEAVVAACKARLKEYDDA
jgi:phage-related protein